MFKLCKRAGCGNLVKKGYCPAHAHLEKKEKQEMHRHYNNNVRDSDAQRFYESPAWRRLRKIQLSRFPFCQLCMTKGKAVPAVIVDHIREIKDGGAGLDLDNLQSVCRGCHNTKTAAERKNRNSYSANVIGRKFSKPTGKEDN